jgi:pimeloyl-ACP methyl ester carboxylesterase
MRYVEWGDPHNPRVLLCVHGLARTGRDFDRLARAMSDRFRVVCPDVAGRGASDRLADPAHYNVGQYAADLVTLIARLGARRVAWVGTSMGGVVGIALAGLAGSPVERLLLNDAGPNLEPGPLQRITGYVGQTGRFATLDEAARHYRAVAPGFCLRSDDEWREVTGLVMKPDGDGLVPAWDPAIAVPMRGLTPPLLEAGTAFLWRRYDGIACPTLVLRGALSDVLTEETAQEMGRRGPRARVETIAGVGHAPMLFAPEQVALARAFLSEEPPPPREPRTC